MNVSVVIPTFARAASLSRTLGALAASTRHGFHDLEIIVVDDGSPVAVADLVEAVRATTAIPLAIVRQPNTGPAAARNRGFREAHGDVVLFVDDDIEVPDDLVSEHVAAHRSHPGSVIFGRCVLPDDAEDPALRCVLDALGGDAGEHAVEFEPSLIVASGQVSVPRILFADRAGVYREDLRTPAAEEYELSARLLRLGIPLLRANRITAIHRTELSLDRVCAGQFNHGRGCAEAAAKVPETLALAELRNVIETQEKSAKSVIGFVKRAASSRTGRRVLLRAAGMSRAVLPRHRAVGLLYRWAIAASFTAGVREGLRDFRGS